MGWTERNQVGRLVVALMDLIDGVPKGCIGVILAVHETFPDGSSCAFPKYDIFFSCGSRIRLERLGVVFDFADHLSDD